MIKFFRRIRQKLLQQGKVRTYLAYAVGEIFLVVVGILLALQINNWNEDRQTFKKTQDLLIRAQKELALNINNANATLLRYKADYPYVYQVINKEVSSEDYRKDPAIAYAIYGAIPTDIDDQAFNNLIEFEGEFSAEQDSLLSKMIKLYKVDKRLVDLLNDQVVENFFEYEKKLKNTQSWYGDYMLYNGLTDEMIDYFLNDPFYYNDVVSFIRINYEEHLRASIHFRTEAIGIYIELSDYLNLSKDSSIVKDIKQYDHYTGLYRSQNDDSRIYRIEQVDNHFVYNTQKNNADSTLIGSFIFYPDTKTHCILKDGFGEFIINEKKEVTSLIYSNGPRKMELTKLK
ncbi:MAG: hypothetical protein AAFO07_17415 [Bacteroidota bacterium]